jgi:hypothetical protein
MNDPRYPVGRFQPRNELSADERAAMIDVIAAAPRRLREAVAGLADAQLDTPYRDGGWTVRQVVHHVPDSHLNAYIRLKQALTVQQPTICPYDESEWAKLADIHTTPVAVSLTLFDALTERWVGLMRAMQPAEFGRTFKHPEHDGVQTLDWLVAMYEWHSRHHVAHITSLRERMGW